VSHDQVRTLLRGYAAAQLTPAEAEIVRDHLATGCETCLQDLFERPVGMPVVAPDVGDHHEVRPRRRLGTVAVVTALAMGALIAWAVSQQRMNADLRRRETTLREQVQRLATRVGEVEARSSQLLAEKDRLADELVGAKGEAEAAHEATAASTEIQRQLKVAEERIASLAQGIRRRDADIRRLLEGIGEERALRELAATPGLRMLRLTPVTPFDDVRGHLLWHPTRTELLLYAFDLPMPAGGARYHVRVTLEDGSVEDGRVVEPDARGDVALIIRPSGAGWRVREVELVHDSTARTVLVGRTEEPSS